MASLHLTTNETRRPYSDFSGKPFWIFNQKEHQELFAKEQGFCCFNHIAGLPRLQGVAKGLFDYEEKIINALNEHKLVWIKKARGLGVTELVLRWMLWLCVRDNALRNSQMAIITGARLELAVDLTKRMKKILACYNYYNLQEKETTMSVNGVSIRAYPSHANTSRGQPNMKVIFLDEADYFDPRQADEAKAAAEGYILKSNPSIIMCSTPNQPGGFYETIERDLSSPYHKLQLPYTLGLGKIYHDDQIKQAMSLPTFSREYNLEYSTTEGNIFPYYHVNKCIAEYDLDLRQETEKILAVDPSYGSSKFGIVGLEKIDSLYYVKLAMQYERPSPSLMIDLIVKLAQDYNNNVMVDSARSGEITELIFKGVNAQPVVFSKVLSDMTVNASKMVKNQEIKIHPQFTDLISQLKAVVANEKGHPDKTRLSFDLGDSFIMACYYIKMLAFHFKALPSY